VPKTKYLRIKGTVVNGVKIQGHPKMAFGKVRACWCGNG